MVRVALSFVPALNSFAHHDVYTELPSLLQIFLKDLDILYQKLNVTTFLFE